MPAQLMERMGDRWTPCRTVRSWWGDLRDDRSVGYPPPAKCHSSGRSLTCAFSSYFQCPSNRSLRWLAVAELSEADVEELVGQAIVDAYGDDEQTAGFYSVISDNLALPFTTKVLGVEASVERVDVTGSGIVAICARGPDRQAIPILDLMLPVPPPLGSEWIAAYRHRAGGQ